MSPVPMLGDLPLEHVTWAETRLTQRLAAVPVVGLAGDAQQNLGRASHVIALAGVIIGEDAADKLGTLQQKAAAGEELDFTSDISTALELAKVVVVDARFTAEAGRPNRYGFELTLRESPPLPPPAEASPFGGLDGLDLGFDTDILGDVLDAAGALQAAVEAAAEAIQQITALAGLADLALGNPLTPMQEAAGGVASVGDPSAGDALGRALGG